MKKQLIVASILLIGLVGFSYRVAPWRVGGSLVATSGTLTADERKAVEAVLRDIG